MPCATPVIRIVERSVKFVGLDENSRMFPVKTKGVALGLPEAIPALAGKQVSFYGALTV